MGRSRTLRARVAAVGIGALGAVALSAGQAQAAVTIGETFAPTIVFVAPTTVITFPPAPAPAPQYAAPSAGVITSWSYQAGPQVPVAMRLKIIRPSGPPNFATVGHSDFELPLANTVNSFPTRVPVLAGDLIGMFAPGTALFGCCRAAAGASVDFFNGPDTALGSVQPYTPIPNHQLDLSAQLEPDADNDGFGDETQDLCPTQADTVKACRDITPPETTILKKPKKKDKKKKPKFEFNSSETAPTFRCSLNGSAFAPCTSPHGVKAKKGSNTFTVFARDAAGNIDETPATYSWTYEKKPKKK